MIYQDEYKVIAVIADGHGDRQCFRASYGSKLAVFTTINILKKINQYDDESLRPLSNRIIKEWKDAVKKHYDSHPTHQIDKDIYLVYGTTLSIVIINDEKMILMNIGDGKCMTRLVDERFLSLINNHHISPESLCYDDASMDICVSYTLPRCLMLTSDGGGSLKDEEEFIDKVENLYLHHRLKFQKDMLGLVDYFSHDDDVSMIWIYKE
ncbi:MAG: protein phosphatase 2C domain-containing protein [Erysipelotrichaceae bacterium]|nr:protein phosphatase 2C domain-containing protein [Erysipelotrichaceae bacterium]